MAQLATILPTYQAQFTHLTDELRAWLGSLGVGPDQIKAAISKINFSSVAGLLGDLLASLAGVFSNMLLLLFVVAFMALDAVRFSRRLSLVRPERPEIVGALDSFVAGTRTYLLVSTIFGLIVAVIDTGFLWWVGVPLPLLWGLLAFITNYIPNVGFIIGVVPPALLGLLQGGPKLMIIVIIGYSLINFVIQSIIQPKVMADAVNLSLTLTFVSLIFWTFVIGAMGAVLAVPLTLLTKALLLDVDPNTRWISSLITGGPTPPEDEDAADAAATTRAAPEVASEEVASQGAALASDGQDPSPSRAGPRVTRVEARSPSWPCTEARRAIALTERSYFGAARLGHVVIGRAWRSEVATRRCTQWRSAALAAAGVSGGRGRSSEMCGTSWSSPPQAMRRGTVDASTVAAWSRSK